MPTLSIPEYRLYTMVLLCYHGAVELPRYTLPGNLGPIGYLGPPFRGLPNVKMVCPTKSTKVDVGSGYRSLAEAVDFHRLVT